MAFPVSAAAAALADGALWLLRRRLGGCALAPRYRCDAERLSSAERVAFRFAGAASLRILLPLPRRRVSAAAANPVLPYTSFHRRRTPTGGRFRHVAVSSPCSCSARWPELQELDHGRPVVRKEKASLSLSPG